MGRSPIVRPGRRGESIRDTFPPHTTRRDIATGSSLTPSRRTSEDSRLAGRWDYGTSSANQKGRSRDRGSTYSLLYSVPLPWCPSPLIPLLGVGVSVWPVTFPLLTSIRLRGLYRTERYKFLFILIGYQAGRLVLDREEGLLPPKYRSGIEGKSLGYPAN